MTSNIQNATVSGRPDALAAAGLVEERSFGVFYPLPGYVLLTPGGNLVNFLVQRDEEISINSSGYAGTNITVDNRPVTLTVFTPMGAHDEGELNMVRAIIRTAERS